MTMLLLNGTLEKCSGLRKKLKSCCRSVSKSRPVTKLGLGTSFFVCSHKDQEIRPTSLPVIVHLCETSTPELFYQICEKEKFVGSDSKDPVYICVGFRFHTHTQRIFRNSKIKKVALESGSCRAVKFFPSILWEVEKKRPL